MLLLGLLSALMIGETVGVVISENETSNGPLSQNVAGQIQIDAGVYWTIENSCSITSGDLIVGNNGGFYFLASCVELTFTMNNIINNGTISVTSMQGESSNLFHVSGDQMLNTGTMFFQDPGYSFQLNAAQWENSGIISLSGFSDNSMMPTISMSSSQGQLINTGDICLTNQNYEMTNSFVGDGCIHVDGQSIFYANDISSKSLENTIFLTGSSAVFAYNPSGSSYTIVGFGDGNVIAKSAECVGYMYNEETGILTISTADQSDYFNIGQGYSGDEFEYVSVSLQNGMVDGTALTYNLQGPNQSSPNCRSCPPAPEIPSDY